MNFIQHILRLFKAHRFAFGACGLLGILLVCLGVQQGTTLKVISFLFTMLGCFLVAEFMYFTGKLKLPSLPVRRPKRELAVVVLVQLLTAALLVYWFLLADPETINGGLKISLLVLRLLLAYPLFILIYFLVIRKYKARQLGLVSFRHWYITLPLVVLIGGVSYLFFPEGLQFRDVLENSGFLSILTLGFLTAAIPEEIMRNLLHTRLHAVINHQGAAWFFTSLVWALVHIPSFASNSGDYYGAFIGALGILPIGLLWGYLNHRFKSILPSVLIHGTNLWGLQNIF